MSKTFQTITPIDDSVYCEHNYSNQDQIDKTIIKAKKAQQKWQATPLGERKSIINKAVEIIYTNKDKLKEEITYQMGRPISQVEGEINGFKQRADYMLEVAKESLEPFYPKQNKGFELSIIKEPLGVLAVLSPWNYPFLTSVNAIIPALIAGNCVILKHSSQTPLVALAYKEAFEQAGLEEGVFEILFLTHRDSAYFLARKEIDGVFFTGSVNGGLAVNESTKNKFIHCGLELGGKDPAYVREDADIKNAAINLVDGSFFNSGQSCCSIERIYVHAKIYAEFLKHFIDTTKEYILGNPLEANTNFGPMVSTKAANTVREQIKDAINKGAKSLIAEDFFKNSNTNTPYLAPHVLVDVDHSMEIMTEETFGPVAAIMKVANDDEAIALMNDSNYGLTASIWSKDKKCAYEIVPRIQTGTVFLNRCDYLDPSLAWCGVKNTGKGATLSKFGYDFVTRLKSLNFKM